MQILLAIFQLFLGYRLKKGQNLPNNVILGPMVFKKLLYNTMKFLGGIKNNPKKESGPMVHTSLP